MSLIFTDRLQATDTSGLYTLMAHIGGVWTDIHTISGARSGNIEVDATLNPISVDTALLIPGHSYDFKWVDGEGTESNVVTLTIPSMSIRQYSAGNGAIEFAQTAGDNFTVTFHGSPVTFQNTNGASVVSYDYKINHWIAGVKVDGENGTKSADYTTSAGGHGAGVYHLTCIYKLSDGSEFEIAKLVKTEASGTIIDTLSFDGITINSVSGLVLNVTANLSQSNTSYPIKWVEYNGNLLVLLGPGNPATLTLPSDTLIVAACFNLDSVFSDFSGDIAAAYLQVQIS